MNDDRPIIVVKKKGDHAGHHGGAWKVAYADFVTAMMAFFLVMWILGLNENVREAIAAYFNNPTGIMKTQAGGANPLSIGHEVPKGKPAILPPSKSILKQMENARFKETKKALEKKIGGLPEFKAVRKYVDITITPQGLRIELLDGTGSLFFETGSARTKPQTEHLLRLIGRELRKLPNNIIMEGHTDARPYAGGDTGYSNWELSTDRANSARRAMVSTLHPDQITEVRGYADRHLREPADPMHYSNRRISILVAYSHQETYDHIPQVGLPSPGGVALPGSVDF